MATTYTVIDAINAAKKADNATLNLWKTLCHSLKGLSHEQAVAAVTSGEEAWKQANPKATSLPSTWRSNKCVALKALKVGVELFDEEAVRGKTEVEKAIKEAAGEAENLDKIRSTLDTLRKLYDKCDSAEERHTARSLLADLSIKLFESAKAQGEAC